MVTCLYKSNEGKIVSPTKLQVPERLKIGDILKRVSLGFLQRKNMGELTTAITTDLAFFEIQAMNVINNIVDSYIFLLITIVFLLFFSPALGISALIAVIIIFYRLTAY